MSGMNKQALGSLLGTGLGAALAIPTGGLSVPAGAAMGGSIGGSAGAMFGPNVQDSNMATTPPAGPGGMQGVQSPAMSLLNGLRQQMMSEEQARQQQAQQLLMTILSSMGQQPQMTATIGNPTVVPGPGGFR